MSTVIVLKDSVFDSSVPKFYPDAAMNDGSIVLFDISRVDSFNGIEVNAENQLVSMAVETSENLLGAAIHPRLNGNMDSFVMKSGGKNELGISGDRSNGTPNGAARIEIPVEVTQYAYNEGAQRNIAISVWARKPVAVNPVYVMGTHSATNESDFDPTLKILEANSSGFKSPFATQDDNLIHHFVTATDAGYLDGSEVSGGNLELTNGTEEIHIRTISNFGVGYVDDESFRVGIYRFHICDLAAAGMSLVEFVESERDYMTKYHPNRADFA